MPDTLPTMEEPTATEAATSPAKKKAVVCGIERKKGVTYFTFKFDTAFEEKYKSLNPETRDSASWPGLKFYYLPDLLKDPFYRNLLDKYNLFDDYGRGLAQDGKLNVAWLRTVGCEGKIPIADAISFASADTMLRSVIRFAKEFFQSYFSNFKVSASLNVQIIE